jgi:hypothetical protein
LSQQIRGSFQRRSRLIKNVNRKKGKILFLPTLQVKGEEKELKNDLERRQVSEHTNQSTNSYPAYKNESVIVRRRRRTQAEIRINQVIESDLETICESRV